MTLAQDALVAHYKLDGDTSDATGNNSDGTLVGDAAFVAGRLNQAISLDGDGDGVDAGNVFDQPSTQPMTVMCWLNSNGAPAAFNTYVEKSAGGGASLGWALRNGSPNNRQKMGFQLSDGTDGFFRFTDIDVLFDAWVHICATYNGNESQSGVSVFLDGVNRTLTGAAGSASYASNTNDLGIGFRIADGSGYVDGIIDEVMIFDRVLTVNEIRSQVATGNQHLAVAHPVGVRLSALFDRVFIGNEPKDSVVVADLNEVTHAVAVNTTEPMAVISHIPGWDWSISLNGTDQYVELDQLGAMPAQWSAVIGFQSDDPTGTDFLFGDVLASDFEGSGGLLRSDADLVYVQGGEVDVLGGGVTNGFHVVGATYDGTTVKVWFDDELLATFDPVAQSSTGSPVRVGASADDMWHLTGEVAAFALTDQVLSDEDMLRAMRAVANPFNLIEPINPVGGSLRL